jgi:ADP-ribose pyrophosphatase
VAALATLAGRVILVRHSRHATRGWHLEPPRGFGGESSSSEENARREIAEEIGATVGDLVSLGVTHPYTGLSVTAVHLWYTELESVGVPERTS